MTLRLVLIGVGVLVVLNSLLGGWLLWVARHPRGRDVPDVPLWVVTLNMVFISVAVVLTLVLVRR